MSLQLLVRPSPDRSIALATTSHVLVLRHSPVQVPVLHNAVSSVRSPPPRCIVEFSTVENTDLADFRSLRRIYGTLGLIHINADVFLCVITGSSAAATIKPGEHVYRIDSVEFYCLNRVDYDMDVHEDVTTRGSVGISSASHDHTYGLDHRDSTVEHPCLALRKVLSAGTFYYSVNIDLTNRLQNRASEESAFDVDSLDESFLWNSYMIDPLIQFRSRLATNDRLSLDDSHILTSAIRGYVSSITIPASSSPIRNLESRLPSTLTLISRLSCRRAGTRFNSRGIDDDGNVANFVESEIIYWFPSGLCFSYAQVRGSVPVFWEQAAGLLPQQQKIQLTRSVEATQPAFDKHFEELELKYGSVHVLNLLSESKPGELELTARYNHHIHECSLNRGLQQGDGSPHALLQQTQFDFHAETRELGYESARTVKDLIHDQADGFAYFMSDNIHEVDIVTKRPESAGVTVLQQDGIFRTNCLDCLDRTNLIQTIISQMAMESFFRHRDEHALSEFWIRHSTLWADNGDALSKIYAGTGALKSSFTRHGKMSFAGAIADARKSATRIYINNFADKGRQNIIDTLLGRLVDQSPVQLYDPINDYVSTELSRRTNEYSTYKDIHVWVGTFNLNGKGKGIGEDLSVWLCPETSNFQKAADIVAVGFQEIVELSPQQIMSTDPARRREWEISVAETLNRNARKNNSEEYVLLRSGQLVGTALIIYVKSGALKFIKNVEGSVKKTGLSGMAGNKGAVSCRLDFANTRICFVTAHLAAGFANYDERNRDYQTISRGLRFQRNRSVDDHDMVIWLGDFNYRIGLSDEKVRKCIKAGDLGMLYQNDQLNLQMVAGHTFPFYSESRITFMPTYKYHNGTDEYDSSEKARIPAWCDRILWKGENIKQIDYSTAPLRFSDHRPIYATFQCTVRMDDEVQRDFLSRDIYNARRAVIGEVTASGHSDEIERKKSNNYLTITPRLPPASSDQRKWWLDNGLPVKSSLPDIHRRVELNPSRPSNPFTSTNEPDWITSSGTTGDRAMKETGSVFQADNRLQQASNAIQNEQLTGPIFGGASDRTTGLSTSSTSSITRKVVPFVPEKPPSLAVQPQPSLPPRVEKSTFIYERPRIIETGFPPPPRRLTVLQLTENAANDRQSLGERVQKAPLTPPSLPLRPTAKVAGMESMMDLQHDELGSTPSLQPRRPGQ